MTRAQCLTTHFSKIDNGLVIRTGSESDLYLLDLDVKGDMDGLADYKQLAAQHDYEFQGPEAETQSGGRHLYFSLSKAKAADVCRRSADVQHNRPDLGGSWGSRWSRHPRRGRNRCGTSFSKYKWLRPLCASTDLPAMPEWLIDALNAARVKRKREDTRVERKVVPRRGQCPLEAVKEAIERHFGSEVIKTWQRDYGFDFDVANRLLPCPICCGTHDGNQYQCKLMLSQLCKVQNHSSECQQTKVNFIIMGWEDNAVIREIVFHPMGEDPYIRLYESWLEMRGERICWDSRGPFYRHNGATWMLYDEAGIATDLKILRERVLKPLAIYVGMQQRNNPKNDDLKKMSEGLDRANAFLMKAHSVEQKSRPASTCCWREAWRRRWTRTPTCSARRTASSTCARASWQSAPLTCG